ncbi:hypothetical protein M8J75_001725 [Diaphorina citri]|nr:hypothetical protein M8J75_001725 [Diaphorina citri]
MISPPLPSSVGNPTRDLLPPRCQDTEFEPPINTVCVGVRKSGRTAYGNHSGDPIESRPDIKWGRRRTHSPDRLFPRTCYNWGGRGRGDRTDRNAGVGKHAEYVGRFMQPHRNNREVNSGKETYRTDTSESNTSEEETSSEESSLFPVAKRQRTASKKKKKETFVLLAGLLLGLSNYAVSQGDINLKKKTMLWREGLAEVTPKICSSSLTATGSRNISFARFKRLLAATASYTMYIKENLAESVTKEILELDRNRLKKHIFRAFQAAPCRNRIVHDVHKRGYRGWILDSSRRRSSTYSYVREPGRISNEGDLSAIQQTQYRGTIFIVAEHGDHWHVLHDCTYTSSQCRNARVEAVTRCFGIRIKRRTIRSIDFNTSYATNVIYYLGRGGRKINYIQIGEYASRRGPGVEVGDLSDGKSAESGAQSVVETRTVENEMRIFLGCTDRGESGGAAEGSGTPLSNQPGSTHKRRKGDNKEDIASTKKTLPFPLCLPTLASMIVEFSISSVPRTFDQETSCSES